MNTHPLTSRNKREGRYAGRCSGMNFRTTKNYHMAQPGTGLMTILLLDRGFI